MPVPFDQLMAHMAGLAAEQPGIEGKSDGLLEDRRYRNPFAPPIPEIKMEDVPGYEREVDKPNEYAPLVPVGDVLNWPKPKGPFQGPTPESAPYMQGKQTAPGVVSIDPSDQFWNAWAQRALNRPLNR